MSIEKISSHPSELVVQQLKEFVKNSDLIEISIKDSFGKNICGRLVEISFDDKTNTPQISLRLPYESELFKVNLLAGEIILAHKTRSFRV
jgi:hypothetical protein